MLYVSLYLISFDESKLIGNSMAVLDAGDSDILSGQTA